MFLISKSLFEIFATGLVTYVFWFGAITAQWLGFNSASIYEHLAYAIGSVLAILIYQPHFVAVYRLGYNFQSRVFAKSFITFFLLPAVFLILIAISIYWEFVLEKTFFSQRSLGLFLAIVLIWGAWHFSLQTYGVLKSYYQGSLHPVFKIFLFIIALFGIFCFTSNHQGVYRLFQASLTIFHLPSESLVFLVKSLLRLLVLVFCIYFFFKGNFIPMLILGAFSLWYLSDIFVNDYFYLIPIFHSLQFFPFYQKKIKVRTFVKEYFLLIMTSIIMIFVLPNIFNITTRVPSQLFVLFLLFLNIHHFAMERHIWKKN